MNLVAPPIERELSCLEGDVGFVELFKEYEIGDVREEVVKEEEGVEGVEELGVEYFDKFPNRDELAYHKYLLRYPNPPFYRRCPIIVGKKSFKPQNTMKYRAGNFTYIMDFLIVEDISSVIDPYLSHVVLGNPFIEVSNMTHDSSLGIVKFKNGVDEVAYQMPHKIE
ncbi:hypothetical protein Tco_0938694 [Tanacetum coccineum]|uniref:Uncharacterized protein n=1 Tax=Tanacetum coccineum TaxID=301880 RepID=A0ABQ5DPX4_9ASTR